MNAQILAARDQATLTTIEDIIEVCNQHEKDLALVPAFVAKLQALRDKRIQINEQSIVKNDSTHDNKVLVSIVVAEKLSLATAVSEMTGLFSEYAAEQKDAKVANMLPSLTLSKLKRSKPLEMVATVQSFLKTAIELDQKTLAHYGIEHSVLPILQARAARYQELEPQKRSSKKGKPKETVNLKTLISELKDIKASMDKLMVAYKTKAPKFWAAYMDVNVVAKNANKTAKSKADKAKTDKNKADKTKTPPSKKGKKAVETPVSDVQEKVTTDKTE